MLSYILPRETLLSLPKKTGLFQKGVFSMLEERYERFAIIVLMIVCCFVGL
ncbi:hypothetical protein BLGI_4284 [Brevibacillus laterosporus GI-9]|nr:hypothetical protein BLGI_4284 [Brevibacillus laterosporus GI-9]